MTALHDMAEAVAAQHRADNWPPRLNAAAFYAAYRQWMEVNAARSGAPLDFDGLPLVGRTDRRLDARKHPLQVFAKRCLFWMFRFGRAQVLVQSGAAQPVEGAEPVRMIQQDIGGERQCELGQSADARPVFGLKQPKGLDVVHLVSPGCVEASGDGESAGRETAPPTDRAGGVQ